MFCCWLVASFHFVYHQGPEWKRQSHFRAAIVFCFCCDLGGLLNAIMPVDSNIRTRTSRTCPHTAEAIKSIGIVLRLLENPIYNSCLVEFHKYKWQNSDQSVMFFSIISHRNEPETFLDYTPYFFFPFFLELYIPPLCKAWDIYLPLLIYNIWAPSYMEHDKVMYLRDLTRPNNNGLL